MTGYALETAESIASIPAAVWDGLNDAAGGTPFSSHAFLLALEQAGCVGGRTGWLPHHLVLRAGDGNGPVRGVAPAYLKLHSQGEYVFDHGWADAWERTGRRYYPKFQAAVPFTPVPGARLLAATQAHQRALAAGLGQVTAGNGLSSAHVTFCTGEEADLMQEEGFLVRHDKQFHWHNNGYSSYEQFLEQLASRKRKALRKERREALANGISIEWKTGTDITESDMDAFFAFYTDTGTRKWGKPYLNRMFFSLIRASMAEKILLVMAVRDGRQVAGAINFIGHDALYGRNWGCVEDHPFLHFEVCYHQAIDFAIERKLARVEAGAQGEHKLARGYLPATTFSAHFIPDAGFRRAVARFLGEERAMVAEQANMLAEHGPFKKTVDQE